PASSSRLSVHAVDFVPESNRTSLESIGNCLEQAATETGHAMSNGIFCACAAELTELPDSSGDFTSGPDKPSDKRLPREVWSWNLEAEFDELLAALAGEDSAFIALDTEFPGFLCEDHLAAHLDLRYWALRENCDLLNPIQLGLAVADKDGLGLGVWTFNLWFDLTTDLHTGESVSFLTAAGVDFPRHAIEGIDPSVLAWKLGASPLLGSHSNSPEWVTFAGWYDWGYLVTWVCLSEALDWAADACRSSFASWVQLLDHS
ncbi:unnamed protein product, partial [Polarella glacialis]